MSIRSKDLQYDKEASQPAFLQRLRNQNASFASSGRQETPAARPQRLRTAADEDEDAPAYVVEGSSEVLSRAEYEKLASGEAGGGEEGRVDAGAAAAAATPGPKGEGPRRPTVLNAGAPGVAGRKKRKAVRVVGADGDDERPRSRRQSPEAAAAAEKKPKKKKANAVKLSFGDEE